MYLYIHFSRFFNVFFLMYLLNGKRPVLVCKMTMSRNVTFHKRYAYMSLKYTLTGHFIGYTLLLLGWTHFCLQNCLNSWWHRFNKVFETFLRDFGPYWHDSITQLLQICRLHIHDANLPFHHIPKELYWWRSGDCGGYLSKVNSLSCSRNKSEMIFALWHGALSCWK